MKLLRVPYSFLQQLVLHEEPKTASALRDFTEGLQAPII